MQKQKRILLCLLPPAAGILALLLREQITALAGLFHACDFLRATGFYCPGCGNTRSVLAMLRLDLFAAIGYNPAPVFAAVIAALAYGELLTWAAEKHRPLVPRIPAFWVTCGVLFALYYICRNFVPGLSLLPAFPWR